MKKSFLLIMLSVITLGGCNLDYAPQNTMVDETVYKAENTAEAALMGAYVKMNYFLGGRYKESGAVIYVTGYTYLFADVGTPTIKNRSYDTYVSMETAVYSTDMHDGYIKSIYLAGYNAIDYANAVIYGVEHFGAYKEETMARHIAEAKFIRAYVYMTLLQLYGDGALTGETNGLGLVLRTDPYDGYNPNLVQSRETVGTIYNQIIKDITEAMPALPSEEYIPASRIRATQGVCKAFLSRVYLYRGSFTNNVEDMNLAAQYASEVINAGAFSFSNLYTDHRDNIFPNNIPVDEAFPDPQNYSNEVIFFQPSRLFSADFGCGLDDYYSKSSFYVDPDFIASYLPGDLRGYVSENDKCLIGQGNISSYATDMTTLKYDNSQGFSDVIYMRLSELKLTYAEATARATGNISSEALAHLNDIRCKPFAAADKPAALTASDFSSVNAFISEVLKERSRELAFEGHTRWDLIRTGRDLKVPTIPNNRKMLPIPEYEVRISEGKIQQNSGFVSD